MTLTKNTNPAGNPFFRIVEPQEGEDRETSDEFERFADLTRKLTQVPKEEVDEQRR